MATSVTQAAGTACEALIHSELPGVVFATAESVAANAAHADRTPLGGGGEALPAHCLVQGAINPRTGADGKPYAIGFELRLPLPAAWNGRFFFQGGGGNDGVLRTASGALWNSTGPNGLAQGFAVASTDSGHLIDKSVPFNGDAVYGLDPQARIDFGYNALDQVTRVAKQLVAAHYGRPADKAYFVGCSNGGRQGFMASQRLPELFDGIVAGDPAFALFDARVAAFAQVAAFKDLATSRDANGRPDLSTVMSDSDLRLLHDTAMQRCDALDGLKDGLIDDVNACRFDPGALQCEGTKTDSCLSPAQVTAVRKVYAGPVNAKGERLYPGELPGSEMAWRGWIFGSSPQRPGVVWTNEGLFKYLAFTPPRPTFEFQDFDIDRDPPAMAATKAIIQATDPDIGTFTRRGGKLLIYHGTADPAQSADYLTAHLARMAVAAGGEAALAKSARLFLVPGMEHCGGGQSLDTFDVLTPLVQWVERGAAPDALPSSGRSFPGRSRPLCAYPKRATYKGSGSSEEATSFVCR